MKRITLLAAAVLLIGAPSTSKAQVNLEMEQITCAAFLGYSPEGREFVRYWMSGYYNAAANSTVLNYDRLQKNSAKVMAYCRKNKTHNLPMAIKQAAS